MNGARIILEMLKGYGVRHVFGLPGETTLGWYKEWNNFPDVEYILTRDERNAAFMAEAYARNTGRPGVFEVPSPGVTHCAPGVAEAYKGGIPLVFFSSDIPLNYDERNMLTGCNQNDLFKGIVKDSFTVTTTADIPFLIRRAFRIATSGKPGPVHIRVPQNIFLNEADNPGLHCQADFSRYPSHRTTDDPEKIRTALRLLREADRPLFFVGQGALNSGAWAELTALAEMLKIPVGTTMTGKGAFPESHPWSAGVMGARGGTSFSNRFVTGADLIFFIGTNTDSAGTDGWKLPSSASGKKMIQLDIEAKDMGNMYPLDLNLLGDAKATLTTMLGMAREEDTTPASSWDVEKITLERTSFRENLFGKEPSSDLPVDPMLFVKAFQKALPEKSLVVCDPGVGGIHTAAFFVQENPGRKFCFNYSMGALGYSIPAAVGASISNREACVVALTGDGSFGFTCGELETISRLGGNINILLFRNDTFGWIRGEATLVHDFDPAFATEFGRVDYAAIARGFGIEAFDVDDPRRLEETLGRAFASPNPTLVVIPVPAEDKQVPPVPKWCAKAAQRGLPHNF